MRREVGMRKKKGAGVCMRSDLILFVLVVVLVLVFVNQNFMGDEYEDDDDKGDSLSRRISKSYGVLFITIDGN